MRDERRDGIYNSFRIGSLSGKEIEIILLDTRFNADKIGGKDLLGSNQWNWLERIMSTKPQPKLTFIVSGYSLFAFQKNYLYQFKSLF